MISQPPDGGKRFKQQQQQQQLNPQLLLIHFILFYHNFIFRELILLVISYIRSILYKNPSTLFFRDFYQPTFLAHLKKSSQNISSSLYKFLQVINKRWTSMINKNFNLHQTKYQFSDHHQSIDLPFDRSM